MINLTLSVCTPVRYILKKKNIMINDWNNFSKYKLFLKKANVTYTTLTL